MTIAPIDSRETTTVKMGHITTFITAILDRISEFRAERKELRSLYSHHSATDATLAQAQREVNRVWLG